jgi:hypothetical protein
MHDIQEAAAMMLDIDLEDGKDLSKITVAADSEPIKVSIPVVIEEHSFRRFPSKTK